MRAKGLISDLVDWVDGVNSRVSSGGVEVVVEGSRDEEALLFVGIRASFTRARDLLRDLMEEGGSRVKGRTFIIMTDFDEEGCSLHSLLKEKIVSLGGRVDDSPRNEYKRKGFPQLIEDLKGFLERRFPDWDLLRSFL